ncbi:A1S_2505 family phage non-structural protein [Tessaracoccus lapidicaptus]|uniref:A1S_2505 family phage non-structural protein n=1 Tax=Tessaracoccus lapidicaptus TaxID=1427523 RepID=UPI0033422D5F
MTPNTFPDDAGRLVASARISSLAPDEVFVFGSNAAGAHGGGAAGFAMDRFGAVWGQGHGPQGRSYAVDSMSGLDVLAREVADFLAYAAAHPDEVFLVTEIGCGIAGYTPDDVAPLFAGAPRNVALPASFLERLPASDAATPGSVPLGADDRVTDRAAGVVVASAAGDALGAPYEFGPPLSDEVTPAFGVGTFGHAPGEWTDDTSMAMPILEAIARGDSLRDPQVLAHIVGRWWEWSRDARDVGAQTRAVLAGIEATGPAAVTEDFMRGRARAVHDAAGRSGGNGSLMRTGPVALAYLAPGTEPELVDAAARIAQLTHWEDDNVDAVVLWSLAIRHAVLTGVLDPRVGLPFVPEPRRHRWAGLIGDATAPGAHPRDFHAQNGWVVRAFQAALAAVTGAADLREALERAVRGGADTDTVAAIAGSLAGAVWGASQVPAEWRASLHGWPGYTVDDLSRLALAALGESPAS